jgi:hypothetical protein
MATTALVDKNSIDLGRRVIAALSRANIPVSVGLWAFVSESEEWRLTIATPLVDELGPLAAYGKVRKALEKAGVGDEFPLRQIFLRSPKDRVVRQLQKERKALGNLGHEDYRLVNASIEGSFVEEAYLYTGFIDILRESPPGSAQEKYLVIYTPAAGGTAPLIRVRGLEQLRDMLERKIGLRRDVSLVALRELDERGDTVIPNVLLRPSDLRRVGLV